MEAKPSSGVSTNKIEYLMMLYSFLRLDSYWEDTPPAEVSDRIGASFPHFLVKLLHQRMAPQIAEMDK